MSIVVTGFSTVTQSHSIAPATEFAGRVVRIERQTETRNLSGTLDYTDNQSVDAVYALVWLGTHAAPGRDRGYNRPMTYASASQYDQPRELKAEEQFAWIDCTNDFTWRGCDYLTPTVDETLEAGAVAALPVWEAHQTFLAAERAAKAAAERVKWEESKRIEAEKAAAKEAKKAAKLEASKAAADADYVMVAPMKGSVVTVAGFTGTLFWIGVKEYRGQYGVRIGVKDAKGNVQWGAAKDLLCVTK
jgi:acetyl/propionyl-CoA carboxylase alpha subunit